jgi:hypothetical protein
MTHLPQARTSQTRRGGRGRDEEEDEGKEEQEEEQLEEQEMEEEEEEGEEELRCRSDAFYQYPPCQVVQRRCRRLQRRRAPLFHGGERTAHVTES